MSIIFDVTGVDSPIIGGMDVRMSNMADNLSRPPMIIMKIPTDDGERMLQTCMAGEDPLKVRLRLLVVPKVLTEPFLGEAGKPGIDIPMKVSVLGEAGKPGIIISMKFNKRIHSLTHSNPQQAIKKCEDAG